MSDATILRDTARGQPCFVRIPGVCNGDPATVVLAHKNGGGMGDKHDDMLAAFACSACHDEIDRRTTYQSIDFVNLCFHEGKDRTQQWWLDHGYIQIVNAPQPRIQKILPRTGF